MNKLSNKNRTIFSFFSGVGFLDLGFESAGFNVALVNEVYEPFLNAYKFARQKMSLEQPKNVILGDMEKFVLGEGKKRLTEIVQKERKHKALIGFIGGPPCPDFSVGGKNLGRNGKHGRLSEIYVKLILQQKPDFFLFENVKGLWKTKAHREFYEELKGKLQKAGYITSEQLINATQYGVPQDRDRIIMVGFKKSLVPKSYVLKKSSELIEGKFPWDKYQLYSKKRLSEVPEEITVGYWFKKNKVEKHPNSAHHFKPREALVKFQTIKEGDTSGKSFKRLHRNKYSPTAAYGNNEVHLHPSQPRRISVAEALAIQSLPRKFSLPATMTLSDMFKAVGNGVPYLAAHSIARSINDFLDSCTNK